MRFPAVPAVAACALIFALWTSPAAGVSGPAQKLPPGAGAAISRAIGADQAGCFAHKTRKGYRFTHGGISVELSGEGASVVSRGRALTLDLTGYGRDGTVEPLPAALPRAHANRVEYDRDGVVEWYANGPSGIEQGFTLVRAPGGSGRLRLEMGVSGGAAAHVDSAGQATSWSAGGREWLRYAGLSAFDARGRKLPARLDLAADRLAISVDDGGSAYPVTIDPFFQEAKLTAPDGAFDDDLGFVAVSGDTIVVGAPGSNSAQGAAYVFVKPAAGWASATEDAKLTASDGAAGDDFGLSVAISGDTVVAGAPNARIGSNSLQGAAYVSVKPEGGIGNPPPEGLLGAAYVFVKPAAGWANATETAKLTASDGGAADDFFLGASVAISGDTVVAGAIGSNAPQGAAYVFVKPAAGWASGTEDAKLTASDGSADGEFGDSVAISGDTVVAGAHFLDIGSSAQGAAYVFVKPSSGWASTSAFDAKLTASDGAANDELGDSVAVSGDTVVAGAPYAMIGSNYAQGAAYVFVKPAAGWASATEDAKLTASDGAAYDFLGYNSVAISGDTVVAGASGATIGSNLAQGAAYVFVKSSAGWTSATEDAKLTASDGASQDGLGFRVAISGDTVVAGAPGATIGTTVAQGAAYVFGRCPTTTTITSIDPPTVEVGQTVTVSFTVTVGSPCSGTPTGDVTVSDGTNSCTGTLTDGSGSCTMTVTHPGALSVTATYPGDGFAGSSSPPTTLQSNPGSAPASVPTLDPRGLLALAVLLSVTGLWLVRSKSS